MRKKNYAPTDDHKCITSAILSVYDDADFTDKRILNKITSPVMNHCKGMSREMAVELIGKIGIADLEGLINLKRLAENCK